MYLSVRHCTLQPGVSRAGVHAWNHEGVYKIHSDWQTCHTVLIRSLDEPMSHPCVICLRVTQQAHGNCESLQEIFCKSSAPRSFKRRASLILHTQKIFCKSSAPVQAVRILGLLALRCWPCVYMCVLYVCTMHIYLRACRPRAFHERCFAWH